jgi:hypothetical protein
MWPTTLIDQRFGVNSLAGGYTSECDVHRRSMTVLRIFLLAAPLCCAGLFFQTGKIAAQTRGHLRIRVCGRDNRCPQPSCSQDKVDKSRVPKMQFNWVDEMRSYVMATAMEFYEP